MAIKSVCVCTCWAVEWNRCITFPGWLVMKELEVCCLYSERSELDFLFILLSLNQFEWNENQMKCSASEDAGLWVCLQETVRRVSIRTPPTLSSAFQSPWATRASRTSSRSENLFMLAQLSPQLFLCGVIPFIPHYIYISHYIYICGCRSFIQSSSIWRCFSPLDLSRGGQQIIETFFF